MQSIVTEYEIDSKKYSGLTKTKLLKLCYLAEYYYYKKYQRRLTAETWFYYLYGPYLFDYDNHLKNCPFSINDTEEGYEIIEKDDGFFKTEGISDFDIKLLIKGIIKEFGEKDLDEILDFIYFETEPMQNTKKRKDMLNFHCIGKEEKEIKQNLSKDDKNRILSKYKEKLNFVRTI